MSVSVFLVCLAVGAGAIALWLDTRLTRLAPSTLRAVLIHVGVALVVAQLAAPGLTRLITAGGSEANAVIAVFAVGLPALTYCFLASIWLIKTAQASLRR